MGMGAILQARMGSSRLKGKVLMKIDEEETIIESVISQLKFSKKLKKIIVATTEKEEDNQIVDKIKELRVNIFRGNENDVLDRYFQCAKKFSLNVVIRITCDNPLIDPKIVDDVIEKFESNDFDCVSNVRSRTFPQGTEVEIFSFKALKKAWEEAKKKSEREHVTQYFYNNPNKFNVFNLSHTENLSDLRLTVDKEDDLKLICKIKSEISKSPILITDILELFSRKPELVKINKN